MLITTILVLFLANILWSAYKDHLQRTGEAQFSAVVRIVSWLLVIALVGFAGLVTLAGLLWHYTTPH